MTKKTKGEVNVSYVQHKTIDFSKAKEEIKWARTP